MNVVIVVAGIFLGAAVADGARFFGLIAGGCIAHLLYRLSVLQRRLAALEDQARTAAAPASQAPAAPAAAAPHPRSAPADAPTWSAQAPEAMAMRMPAHAPRASAPSAAPTSTPAPANADAAPAPAPAAALFREASAPARPAAAAFPSDPPAPHPALRWLLGGNTVVRVGVLILFFGVAFLLKYAYEHSHLPPELRLAGVSVLAIALLALGWRLRHSRSAYALTLQGGGVGVLYLTIYAALRLYEILPPAPAFALLACVAGFSALLAIAQDSLALAVVGVTGGFLAPVLASTGTGSHVLLFSYFLVLDLGIVAIAWKRAWRALNLVGFAFTLVLGSLWGKSAYTPELFATTEAFLVLFFLLFVLLPVLFARHAYERSGLYVDGALVFGVPVAAFGLQAALVRDIPYGAAWSAVALAFFYFCLTFALWRRAGSARALLAEAFLALGGGFTTLAIPLAFDGRTTSAAWAIEGAAVVWVGVRQRHLLSRLGGYALQIAAGAAFFFDLTRAPETLPILNSAFLGCALIAGASLTCSLLCARARAALHPAEGLMPGLALAWGLLWWIGGGLHEIDLHLAPGDHIHAALLFVAGSALGLRLLARALAWPVARWGAYLCVPALTLALLGDVLTDAGAFAHLGALAWPLAFGAHLAILRLDGGEEPRLCHGLHTLGYCVFALVFANGCTRMVHDLSIESTPEGFAPAGAAWHIASWGSALAATLWLPHARALQARWPVAAHAGAYRRDAVVPLALGLLAWVVWANVVTDGDDAPLAYTVLLNPLDLALIFVLLTLARALLRLRKDAVLVPLRAHFVAALALVAAAAFFALNAIVLRALHHWAEIPYAFAPLWRSVLVQASFALLWSVTALAIMAVAARRGQREAWMTGAALMGAVVVKLLLVDLSDVGGIARIVSFLGVGALMLVIGYVAPVPPRARARPLEEEA